jgi:hypothetical protein
VVELELLVDRDVVAAAGKCARCCQPLDSRSDDRRPHGHIVPEAIVFAVE